MQRAADSSSNLKRLEPDSVGFHNLSGPLDDTPKVFETSQGPRNEGAALEFRFENFLGHPNFPTQ